MMLPVINVLNLNDISTKPPLTMIDYMYTPMFYNDVITHRYHNPDAGLCNKGYPK